ncbi:hypothetical protein D1B31_08535 [Neobacillus notoginsengisoli]|uniref:Helix-hairpin-helix DNA-binding motif class 1 domain-containing protein n=1 Tax=Neobacillus notoginsengisoli TaxID=1578198 RepID=A0A417YUK7_9BACI|nr:helix-hairpin-helix domain-containing protein [Neobacillus notoginsengisoli]RHW40984.1 hypothetical protein D1B31_08535 [Neobacillus notoginsengisoli]
MKAWLLENKYYAAAALIVLAVFVYFSQKDSLTEPPGENEILQAQAADRENEGLGVKEENDIPEIILVDVKGAVKKPGVYKGEKEERVVDLIQRAGGLAEHADASQVNFAQRIEDEMVIVIPLQGEVEPAAVPLASTGEKGGDKININKADVAELQNIPGIGPAKAVAIIDYREKNGPFKNPEELKEVSGIGEKTFEKLEGAITVR